MLLRSLLLLGLLGLLSVGSPISSSQMQNVKWNEPAVELADGGDPPPPIECGIYDICKA